MRTTIRLTPLLLLAATAAGAEPRVYDASRADQFLGSVAEDIVPEDPAAREAWARATAYQAALFARAPVLTWNQMHDQAVDRADPGYVGFNRFAHGRDLAGPDYAPFKSPNADTLYSNAYLDLRAGPVLFTVPDTGGRYFTANFLDMGGNATNISARTHGTRGGRFLIATTDWGGTVPPGVTLFRVAQPLMWILLRIEAEDAAGVADARRLQEGFTLAATAPEAPASAFPARARLDDPASVLATLDWLVSEAGVRREELALVHQFRGLGVGGPRRVAEALADPVTRRGVDAGFADAGLTIERTLAQNGQAVGAWREPADIGRYGFNYVYRASVNTLGTGANVRLENFAFTTFTDGQGAALDGAQHAYVLRLPAPPPADFFWSVTVYDRRTRALVPNAAAKYLVSGRTPGLVRGRDGSVTIHMARDARGPNAIPLPDGPFYVALRAQGPRRDLLTGAWKPAPIVVEGAR